MQEDILALYVRNVIRKYELKYPLDIEEFAITLGFDIKYVDTGNSDAYTLIYGGKKTILLNKDITNRKRINFTIAHELGHYFIPHHSKSLYDCNTEQVFNLNNPKYEIEADIFASQLLLPNVVMQKNNCINDLADIINLSDGYGTSLPATAIRMVEFTDDAVCFICCKDRRIKWFAVSLSFKENFKLKYLKNTSVPNLSLAHECITSGVCNQTGKAPAFIWLDDIEPGLFIKETVLHFTDYNETYILILANHLLEE